MPLQLTSLSSDQELSGEPAERKPNHANGAAAEPKTTPTHASVPSPAAPGLRYLALGDSYTCGEKVAEGDRFPNLLSKRLRAKGFEMRSPQIIAHTGWTTADLAAALAQAGPQGPFDLVTLLVGVNNQYRGLSLEDYARDFAALTGQAVDLAGSDPSRVIAISIPDWGVMPYASSFDRALIAQKIDAFNAANKKAAIAQGVRYVNITPLTRKAAENPALAAPDGLHPSGKQYQLWLEILLPEAIAALRH